VDASLLEVLEIWTKELADYALSKDWNTSWKLVRDKVSMQKVLRLVENWREIKRM